MQNTNLSGILKRSAERYPDNTALVPDDTLGERVAVDVVLNPDEELDRAALKKFIRKGLAPYKIPKQVEFIQEPAVST